MINSSSTAFKILPVYLNIYFQKDRKLKKVEVEGVYIPPYFHFIYSEGERIVAPQYNVGFLSSSPWLQQLEIASCLKKITLDCDSNSFYPLPWETPEDIKIGLEASFVRMCFEDITLLGYHFYDDLPIDLYLHPLYKGLAKATQLDIEQNYYNDRQLETICTLFASSLVKYAKGNDFNLAQFEEGLRELSYLSLKNCFKIRPKQRGILQCCYPIDFIFTRYSLEELVKASKVRFPQRIYGCLNPVGFSIKQQNSILGYFYKDVFLEKQNYYIFPSEFGSLK